MSIIGVMLYLCVYSISKSDNFSVTAVWKLTDSTVAGQG